MTIRVEIIHDIPSASVDTPEDVRRVAALLAGG